MSTTLSDADIDFTKLKVAELKAELKKRGLSTDGKKSDLIDRLQTSIGDSALLDDTHDDLLDDDDLSDGALDDPAIVSSLEIPEDKPTKRPAEKTDQQPAAKKIVLNRNVVEAPDPPAAETETPTPTETESTASGPKIVSKIGNLSMNERLAKRKARFSGSGSATSNVITVEKDPSVPVVNKANATIDVLKKRAERFGTVAPVLEKAQLEEKKLLRLKRFGGDEKSGSNGALADKKAQRAARFQITS